MSAVIVIVGLVVLVGGVVLAVMYGNEHGPYGSRESRIGRGKPDFSVPQVRVCCQNCGSINASGPDTDQTLGIFQEALAQGPQCVECGSSNLAISR